MTAAAGDLRERFAVHGRYYEAAFGGRMFALRSHLEIFERGRPWTEVCRADADLVAIMMNPGGSRPLVELDANGWASGVPDRTQYQLMKLALHAGEVGRPIRHIRVINLSDLRMPQSAQLFAALRELRDEPHSIFDPRRRAELRQSLGASQVPVLRAWGLATQLESLARAAIAATDGRTLLGLSEDGLRYRHPLPQRVDQQRRWLEQMAQQIEGLP